MTTPETDEELAKKVLYISVTAGDAYELARRLLTRIENDKAAQEALRKLEAIASAASMTSGTRAKELADEYYTWKALNAFEKERGLI